MAPTTDISLTDDWIGDYLDSIATLPDEINFNMQLLRDMDESFQSQIDNMRHNARSYAAIMKLRKHPTHPSSLLIGADKNARASLNGYRSDYKSALSQAEQKILLSHQILSQFSSHLARLDKLVSKLEQSCDNNNKRKKDSHSSRKQRKRPRITDSSDDDDDQLATATADTLYCICRQVSYGDMVGCDNPDCPIEWFHYPCVGLVSPPKGKWYCSQCLDDKFNFDDDEDEVIDVEETDDDFHIKREHGDEKKKKSRR